MNEDREAVTNEPAPETVITEEPAVAQRTHRVLTEEPTTTYVQRSNPIGNAFAASSLIQTIVWAVVVLVLLVVAILVLVHYKILG